MVEEREKEKEVAAEKKESEKEHRKAAVRSVKKCLSNKKN